MRGSSVGIAFTSRFAVGTALGALVLATAPAWAQDAVADPMNPDGVGMASGEAIVVTGSRIQRDGTQAPTPVTVIGADLLNQRASTNVADTLNELPAFRPLVTPATQQAVGGNVGARVLDLRGLGGARTLVLLDGKRFVPSTQQGTVDINLIPTALVERTEVVTGGASAAYGSDAVAGVVNFILDRNLTGFKGTVQYGIAQEGDNEEWYASLAYGAEVNGGRGHFLIATEYSDAEGMGDCYTRSWCPNEMVIPGGGPGFPASMRGGPAQLGLLSNDGLITGGPLLGTTFNPDGSLRQYEFGETFTAGSTGFLNRGGEESLANGLLVGTLLIPPVERFTLYTHAEYELTDAITASLDLSYGQVNGLVKGSPPRGNFVIQRDNAFLPDELGAAMDENDLTTVTIGRSFTDIGNPVDRTKNGTFRAVFSLNGNLGSGWSWDAYYQYGRNDFRQTYSNNFVGARATLAVDAVETPGGVVCRVNADADPTNDDPACVPLNVFGSGNGSAESIAYIATRGFQSALTNQHVAAANVQGSLFELPGGALQVALGGEYRHDRMTGDADGLSTANAFWSFNGKAIEGSIQVAEGYAEVVAPVLADLPGAELLELNGAIRQTFYERSSPTTGGSSVDVTTWKLGAIYAPVDMLRFRVTRSRDIRAPNLAELFGPVNAGRTTIVDPANNAQQIQIVAFSGANPLLEPEVADTWTVGAVLTPDISFGRRLSLSVDYFDISLDGAIGSLGAQTIVNRCAEGATEFCDLVRRDGANQLIDVQDVFLNINQQRNRGIDFEFNYATNAQSWGALALRLLATRYLELSTTDSAGTVDRAGQTGYRPGTTTGMPDWVVNANVNWEMDALTLGLHANYISKGIFDVMFVGPEDAGYDVTRPDSVNSNRVDDAFTLDFNMAYKVNDAIEVFGVVNNLLNSNPPRAASAQGATNQVYFDPIGRYFKVGARIRLP